MYLSVTMWLYFLLKIFLVLNGISSCNVNCIVMLKKKTFWGYNQQQNCRDIFFKCGNFREQNNPQTLPSIQSWGVCCFLQVAQTAAQHWVERMGKEKLYCSLFKLAKCQRGPCINFGKQIQMVIFPLIEHICINSFENLLLNLQKRTNLRSKIRKAPINKCHCHKWCYKDKT